MTKQQEYRKQTEEAKFEAFSLMCKKVADLEKENAELKEHIKADCIDCADYIKNQKLEKENHLLGERCNQLLKDKGKLTDKVKSLEEDKNKRLEQAKEIIEDFMITETGGIGYSKLYDKAGKFLKKFLKEIEK